MDAEDVDEDPTVTLAGWLDAARQAGEPLPQAMALATASPDGVPSARMVILRGLDQRGLVFYTDRESHKGRDLDANPRATLVFHWHLPCHRQVSVSGEVEPASEEEQSGYWRSSPPEVRRAIVASCQSEVVSGRALLEERVAELAREHPDDTDLLRPERWCGYRVRPAIVELWEEREDRLHDRLRYCRDDDRWSLERLSP
jgi:pyridoxamine 5'-phosphate oxidase